MSLYILWAVVAVMACFIIALFEKISWISKYEEASVPKSGIESFLNDNIIDILQSKEEASYWLKMNIKAVISDYEFSDIYEHAERINKEINERFRDGEEYIDEIVSRINKKQLK